MVDKKTARLNAMRSNTNRYVAGKITQSQYEKNEASIRKRYGGKSKTSNQSKNALAGMKSVSSSNKSKKGSVKKGSGYWRRRYFALKGKK